MKLRRQSFTNRGISGRDFILNLKTNFKQLYLFIKSIFLEMFTIVMVKVKIKYLFELALIFKKSCRRNIFAGKLF